MTEVLDILFISIMFNFKYQIKEKRFFYLKYVIAGTFDTTNNGNKYIMVVIDYFRKWDEAYAIPNQESITVADIMVKETFNQFPLLPNE